MTARDRHEEHRAATPLELLFDLCFVVAVAQAAASLHHAVEAGHSLHGIGAFIPVFFAIWWAWMNFTWFASAYDNDDVPFRLLALLQITGVLMIAAGVPRAFDRLDYSVVTAGYAVMRIGLVACWLRAARGDDDAARRRTARRYAAGITLCEVGWITLALLPTTWWIWGFVVMCPMELAVPVWAERVAATPWHPHHIVERYSLMVLIVIGESVMSATVAIQIVVDAGHRTAPLVAVIAGAILVLFSAWWIYFDQPPQQVRRTGRDAFLWGYGHYFVFASLAATGAGLAAATDIIVGRAHTPAWIAGAAVAIPVSIFLACVYLLVLRPARCHPRVSVAYAIAIPLVLAAIAAPAPVLVVGLVLALLAGVTRSRH
jgi:low temperature requirement protein LtrA